MPEQQPSSTGPSRPGLPERYRRALAMTEREIGAIRPADWTRPTPCDGWDVRTVVNHLVAGTLNSTLAVLTGTATGREYVGDRPGSDPAAAFRAAARAGAEAWTHDVQLDRMLVMPYGTFPASSVIGVSVLELLVHSWDLARARSVAPGLDEEDCEQALRFARKLPSELRLGDNPPYRPAVDVASSASAADRLAAFLGRDPSWSADESPLVSQGVIG